MDSRKPMHRCRAGTAPAYEVPPLPLRVVRDELPFQRPMGGIVYGIRAAATELCFVTSCDVPFLNSASIRLLIAALGDADVAEPFWQDRLQPLQAVYHRSV
jgi:molybdopterin-guanine dinucleotide biosynthesis protein A